MRGFRGKRGRGKWRGGSRVRVVRWVSRWWWWWWAVAATAVHHLVFLESGEFDGLRKGDRAERLNFAT